jgi:hypothetical protein
MRKLAVGMVALALVVGAAWTVLADTTSGRTPLKCMDTVWRTTPESTSSTQWAAVPGFADRPTAIFPIAVNVSATVSGAPVLFRVLSTNVGGQTSVSKPGPTEFTPGGHPSAFSYQWIEPNPVAAPHNAFIRLQWRSPSGNPVHLLRGDMSLLYATDGCQGA